MSVLFYRNYHSFALIKRKAFAHHRRPSKSFSFSTPKVLLPHKNSHWTSSPSTHFAPAPTDICEQPMLEHVLLLWDNNYQLRIIYLSWWIATQITLCCLQAAQYHFLVTSRMMIHHKLAFFIACSTMKAIFFLAHISLCAYSTHDDRFQANALRRLFFRSSRICGRLHARTFNRVSMIDITTYI